MLFFSVLCLLCLCARLFICALWSHTGKGLTSWLSFVVTNCEFVTFPLVSWVRGGTWLYRFLIFAPLLNLTKKTCYFCKSENHHHRSLCQQNVNNYYVPSNKFKIFDFKKELRSRQDSLVKSRRQSIQNTGNNEPLSEETETLYYKIQVKLVNIIKF